MGCETIYPISQSTKIATIKFIQNHCNIVETFFRNLVFVNIPLPSIVQNPYGEKVFLLFFDKTFNPFLHQRTKVLLRKEKSLSSENSGKVRKLGTIFWSTTSLKRKIVCRHVLWRSYQFLFIKPIVQSYTRVLWCDEQIIWMITTKGGFQGHNYFILHHKIT